MQPSLPPSSRDLTPTLPRLLTQVRRRKCSGPIAIGPLSPSAGGGLGRGESAVEPAKEHRDCPLPARCSSVAADGEREPRSAVLPLEEGQGSKGRLVLPCPP